MITIGSIIVPTSAVVLLSVVTLVLLILLFMLLYLNKVCCFANCEFRSTIFADDKTRLQTDSESDDSDEDILTNYNQVEKSVMLTSSRQSSRRDIHGIECSSSENCKNEPLKHSRKSSIGNKTSIIRISISHDTLHSKLKIQILQLFHLAEPMIDFEINKRLSVEDIQKASHYQIHCLVLPEKIHQFKTRSKNGPDPSFNETFYVERISIEKATSMELKFGLYTSHQSSTIFAGQCIFDLNTVDLTVHSEYNLTMTYPGGDEVTGDEDVSFTGLELLHIKAVDTDVTDGLPELEVGLSYNSNSGRLTVEIIRGCNLSKDKNKVFYVKLSLFSSSGSELSHTKTSVRKNTNSPVFLESFMFQLAIFQLKDVTLMVSVFTKKSIHRKGIVGWVSLGYKSSGDEEQEHWNEIRHVDCQQIVRRHRLHQNLNVKNHLQ